MMSQTLEQNFLQSPEWEKFQRASGHEVFRAGGSLLVEHSLPIVGKYAYCPRGPVLEISNIKYQIENTIQEGRKRRCGWIRIEPNSEEEWNTIKKSILHFPITYNLLPITWRRAPRDTQPREILVMDIAKSEEQLLSEMKPKTRYNIRLAEKKGVKIIVSKEEKYIAKFVELVRETALRAGIRPHPESHYRKMLSSLGDVAELYNAEYEGKIIAANMMIFFGDGAMYLHGGSGNAHRNVMAPFLLQWRAMQDAKAKGCQWYDFGGVNTRNSQLGTCNSKLEIHTQDPKSQALIPKIKAPSSKLQVPSDWAGITNFKQGFCPQTAPARFPGTYDIILNPWRYQVYRSLNRIKGIANMLK